MALGDFFGDDFFSDLLGEFASNAIGGIFTNKAQKAQDQSVVANLQAQLKLAKVGYAVTAQDLARENTINIANYNIQGRNNLRDAKDNLRAFNAETVASLRRVGVQSSQTAGVVAQAGQRRLNKNIEDVLNDTEYLINLANASTKAAQKTYSDAAKTTDTINEALIGDVQKAQKSARDNAFIGGIVGDTLSSLGDG